MRPSDTPKITVAIRKRPLNKKQVQRGQTDIIRVSPPGQVTISEYKQKVDLTKYLEETTFAFDHAYDERSSNEQIYAQCIRPLVHNAFQGAKISCFAYGQTGSGKTFTMKGDIKQGVPGLYYLGAAEIFRLLEEPQHSHLHVTVSFYEIYCKKLYDLLNNRAELPLRQDKNQNINVIGMEEKEICSAQQFMEVIEYGSTFRVTSQNATNADSSRSHAILQISLKDHKKVFTKISFIDLAGNERGADHMNQNKQTQIDGAEINKSLLSLKECIRALDQGKSHTPFRGSKLTMVLKDSFVGFCNTVMICNVSPNLSSSENTLNTLRYADRVKELKGQDPRESLTREELLSRELMLPRANNKNCIKVNIDNHDDDEDIMNKMEQARVQHQQQLPRNRYEEEKMEIEEPIENKKPILLLPSRKSENNAEGRPNNPPSDRRYPSAKDTRSLKTGNQSIPNNFRGRDLLAEADKQPLLSHNVTSLPIKQNNLNFANSPHDQINFNKRLLRPTPNRVHFEAMTNLRNEFDLHREQHDQLIAEQHSIIKDEIMLAEQPRKIGYSGNTPEEEIEDLNKYLSQMEHCLIQKIELFNMLKNNIDKIKNTAKVAAEATAKMRLEQQQQTETNTRPNIFLGNGFSVNNANACRSQTKLHLHSTANCVNFSGFNQYGGSFDDDQLLEGLPGDDTMSRLF